jgi:hypothetical protein
MGLLHKIKHKAHHAVHNPPAIHISAPVYHAPPVHIQAPPIHIPVPIHIPDPPKMPKIVIPKVLVPQPPQLPKVIPKIVVPSPPQLPKMIPKIVANSIPKLPKMIPKMVTAIKLPKMPDLGGGSNHKDKSTGGSKQKPGLSEGEIIAVAAIAAVSIGIFFYV